MKDLRVALAVDLLQVTRLSLSPDLPGYVRMSGPQLGTANEVRIDGGIASSVIVIDGNTIDVAPPNGLKTPIRNVEVRSLNFTGRASASVSFEMHMDWAATEGLAKLVQAFLCLLLTTPGSDAFHQDEGGGLRSGLSSGINKDDRSTYATPIAASVERTKQQMLRSQAVGRIPLDERLRDVQVRNISFVASSGEVRIELGLTSMAGHTAVAAFGTAGSVS